VTAQKKVNPELGGGTKVTLLDTTVCPMNCYKKFIFQKVTTTKCNTVSCPHWNCINDYYKSLVNALTTAANYNIPFVHSNTFKSFWTSELSELKEASYNAHQLWILCGKPNSGIVNDLRRESKYKYKLALRQAMRQEELRVQRKYY